MTCRHRTTTGASPMDSMVSAHTWGGGDTGGPQPVRTGIHFKIKAFDCSYIPRSYFYSLGRNSKSYKRTFLKGPLKVYLFFSIIQYGCHFKRHGWPVKSLLFWVSLLVKLRYCVSALTTYADDQICSEGLSWRGGGGSGGSRLNLTVSLDWGDYSTHTYPHTASLSGLFSPSLTPSC